MIASDTFIQTPFSNLFSQEEIWLLPVHDGRGGMTLKMDYYHLNSFVT